MKSFMIEKHKRGKKINKIKYKFKAYKDHKI